MKYLTIHKSKGLESEKTIIINLEDKYDSLPSKIEEIEYLKYVKPKTDNFKYSEERRLFYVALTRCRLYNILLVKNDHPSVSKRKKAAIYEQNRNDCSYLYLHRDDEKG